MVTIRSMPALGEKAQRCLEILGPIADHGDVRDLDPELTESL